MNIASFKPEHLQGAYALVYANYQEQCAHVPMLDMDIPTPDLTEFANNEMGVAAFEGEDMVGFLGACRSFDSSLGITSVNNILSPLHGHAAIPDGRAEIYARMYQAAARRWVKRGSLSHTICLYADDFRVIEELYRHGFGLCCIDAIRKMAAIPTHPQVKIIVTELKGDERLLVYPLNAMLVEHMAKSPTFMRYPVLTKEMFMDGLAGKDSWYFAAWSEGVIVAYIKIANQGKNFICDAPQMQNICGAFCLREYRGLNVMQTLLNGMIDILQQEGYTRLGVDYESINPAARKFWLKYFLPYAYNVVRRIDEYAL